jgi:hypothetical protein
VPISASVEEYLSDPHPAGWVAACSMVIRYKSIVKRLVPRSSDSSLRWLNPLPLKNDNLERMGGERKEKKDVLFVCE